jgi:hypothetical protein
MAARAWLDRTPAGRTAALVAVITDLGVPHATWRADGADLVVAPASGPAPARTARAARQPGATDKIVLTGLPVGDGFRPGPATRVERGELRRSVGQRESALPRRGPRGHLDHLRAG